jgi:two-component system osmolarity sensor histidine kinase EnvZ
MALALEELRSDAERNGHTATVTFHGLPVVTVKPASFKRCLANLVSNAGAARQRDLRSPAIATTAISR